MAEKILHVHNQAGLTLIRVRRKEFMCIGALPPLDHPHVYLNMGSREEISCSYCATKFQYDPTLAQETEPVSSLYETN